jgi:hypothetical protein
MSQKFQTELYLASFHDLAALLNVLFSAVLDNLPQLVRQSVSSLMQLFLCLFVLAKVGILISECVELSYKSVQNFLLVIETAQVGQEFVLQLRKEMESALTVSTNALENALHLSPETRCELLPHLDQHGAEVGVNVVALHFASGNLNLRYVIRINNATERSFVLRKRRRKFTSGASIFIFFYSRSISLISTRLAKLMLTHVSPSHRLRFDSLMGFLLDFGLNFGSKFIASSIAHLRLVAKYVLNGFANALGDLLLTAVCLDDLHKTAVLILISKLVEPPFKTIRRLVKCDEAVCE